MRRERYGEESITLRGEEVPLKLMLLPQNELKYYPENPRIYTIISANEKEPTQQEIEETLLQREYVKQLIQSIKANGGLTDPLFVLDKSYIVIEGNSRLAAYRSLASHDAIKWGKVKCKVLPAEIEEDKIFALLGEYHIIGKQDWAPYEQAGYLYRRFKKHNVTPEQMSVELGLTVGKIRVLINIYSFMVKNKDNRPERWSFYEQYLKKNILKNARKKYEKLDRKVVSMIKSGEIRKAADIRDNLTVIFKADKKVIKNFLSDNYEFYEAAERARSGGADEHNYLKIKRFKEWITNEKVHVELYEMNSRVQKKCLFQFKKIMSALKILKQRMK